jgi:hypothetical protein
MTGLRCDAEALRAAAVVLDEVGDRTNACRSGGTATDPALWGPLGQAVGAPAQYQALVGAIEEHLTAGRRFCDRAAGALRRSAAAYEDAEAGGAAGFAGATRLSGRHCHVG